MEPQTTNEPRETKPRAKRASKRRLRIAAAGSAAVAFALPWAALKAMPRPPAPPAQVVVVHGGKVVKATVASASSSSITTTRASGAPPIH